MKQVNLGFLLVLGSSMFCWSQNLQQTYPRTLKMPQGNWQYLVGNEGKKALLFIHGASSSKNFWHHQYALSMEGYKNIFVDLLGYGGSGHPDSTYQLDQWIKGLHAILDQEMIEEVALVGHSNGAIIAKEYYRAFPERVSHLILLDGMLRPMIPQQMLDWMRSTLERSDYEEFMRGNIQRMPVQGLSEEDADVLKGDALKVPKAVTRGELDMISAPTTWRDLVLNCPVTIVLANNPYWSEEYIESLGVMAPDHQLIKWEDAGHFIPMQYPQRLHQLIHKSLLNP